MSWFGDALKFEDFRLGEFWKGIKDDPQRLFTGAFDPIGTGIYNGVTGDNLEPLGNQLGAPTEDQYAKADAKGIPTDNARSMNDIAQVVAMIYGGQALSGAAGAGGSASGSTGGVVTDGARYGAALAGSSSGGSPSPAFGAPPQAKPVQFRDTFQESQRARRRKGMARALQRVR